MIPGEREELIEKIAFAMYRADVKHKVGATSDKAIQVVWDNLSLHLKDSWLSMAEDVFTEIEDALG